MSLETEVVKGVGGSIATAGTIALPSSVSMVTFGATGREGSGGASGADASSCWPRTCGKLLSELGA